MGLTSAMFTSLTGMSANSVAINVSGDNLANVNTTAFKASRARFETHISRTLAEATAPRNELGGRNPSQVGLGTRLGAITRSFEEGSIQTTGVVSDLAVEGNGFFVLDIGGVSRYTRAGNFTLDRDFRLVNPDGARVQGFGVNDDFEVVDGILGDVVIPIGTRTLAEATTAINFGGNLNAGGNVATVGSLITSAPVYADAAATVPAQATDDLDQLHDADGRVLFQTSDVVTVTGARRGGATLPDHTFEVGLANTTGSDAAGTTLQSYLTFLEQVLGIDTAVSGGVAMAADGALTVEGNTGSVNELFLEDANVIVNRTTNPAIPFNFAKQREADGESVRTTFVAFDSLGTPMTLDLSTVLESKSNAGTAWRFYVQSEDDTDVDRVLGNGTMSFDPNGQLAAVSDTAFTIDRDDTGSFTPQNMDLVFDDPVGAVSALTDQTSDLAALGQDGTARGTLQNYAIDRDGTILGAFSNSLSRPLGRIPLAVFANPQGLEDVSGNLFEVTVNSGNAAVVGAGSGGSGQIVGGALERANVDLSQEFINLIAASTGFTANSRVLTTIERMVQDLLAVLR